MKLPKFGTGTSLERVSYLINYFNINIEDISKKSIVVTGSNGKGSTSKIASELLKSLNLKTGLFTSPHLYQYNERFQINGIPISNEILRIKMDEIMNAIQEYEKQHSEQFGAFEAQYILALKWFSESNVDCMVLEAGIGGRYDPVRTAQSTVTGLVSLDLEHTELLGETLLDIALDKMDACAPGGTLICGESCNKIIESSHAKSKALNIQFLSNNFWTLNNVNNGYQYFDIHINELEFKLQSKLVGEHQLNNNAVAIKLCHELLKQQGRWNYDLAKKHWPKAIAEVYWPGRLEKIRDYPLTYIDVGHTPNAVDSALKGFQSLTSNQPALLVLGSSYNKKYEEMISLLVPAFNIIICTAAYHKGMAASDLEQYVRKNNANALIYVEATIESAVKKAINEAKKHELNIYVAGGLFLATEFAYSLRGGNAKELQLSQFN